MVRLQSYSKTSGANILVTGAGGFIGSQLTEYLLSLGHHVWGLDSFDPFYSPQLKRENLRLGLERGLNFESVDLAKEEIPWADIPFDYIFHLAAQAGLDPHAPFSRYVSANVSATERLVEFATQQETLRLFVQVSTSSVYGKVAIQSEDALPRPISPYGVTKLTAEQVALSKWRTQGLPVCVLRLYSVYGPRERPDKLFPRMIEVMRSGGQLPLRRGSLQHRRSFTYVEDVVRGLASVLDKEDRLSGEIINVGSGSDDLIEDAIHLVQEIWGAKCKFAWVDPIPGDPLRTQAHIKKAERLLSFNPQYSLREGLAKQLDWEKGRGRTVLIQPS